MNDNFLLESKIKLEKENKRLQTSLQELSILNDIATAVSSTLSLNRIIELIVNKCIKHMGVEQSSIMLYDFNNAASPFHTIVRKADVSDFSRPYRFDEQLTGWMLKNQRTLVIDDFKNDTRFYTGNSEGLLINSLLCTPLIFKGKMIGVISVFNKKEGKKFNRDDQRLLSIIASQSAHVIESARLLEEEKQYMSIREELRMAKDIQVNLLPKEIPKIPGYDIKAINIPAREVGGDYYDFISISETRIGFCLGDVSGKGLPAAVLMGNLQATIRGQTLIDSPCRERISRANKLLFGSTDPSKFATLFYGILDFETHKICYCNAGHNYPYLFHNDSSYKRLDIGGILLGCIPDTPYDDTIIQIKPGDNLILYTDGFTEAFNKDEEEFGEERFGEILNNNHHDSSQNLVDKLIEAVRKHSEGEPQTDDMTIMIIKRE